ncbi:MAG: DegV family protein [Dehalococcoidia bacterium]|nr:DegV family protein [Dehalococcoidia bacterium]
MAVKIVTDSTSDIPVEVAESLGITIIPLTILFGQETFRDRVDMSTEEFYRRLVRENVLPTTTQPAPGVFAEAYEKLIGGTSDEVLTIVLSGRLSGTYTSAMNAIDMVNGNGRIEVIDSKLAAMSLGLVVVAAAKLAQQKDMTLRRLTEEVRHRLKCANIIVAFDTMKYLAKGGRIGKAQGLLGSLLSVKPVLTLRDGEVAPLTRLRTMKLASDYLYNYVASMKKIEALAVEYATTPHEADVLAMRLGALFPHEQILRSTVSPVLGTYMGPNVLAVSFIEA